MCDVRVGGRCLSEIFDHHLPFCITHIFHKVRQNLGSYLSIFSTRMADGSLNDKLCRASARGNLAEVLLMLQNGAEVNGFNMFKRTALQVGMTLLKICLCKRNLSRPSSLHFCW